MSKASSKDGEISLKQILDAIQKQSEIHARTTAEVQEQIQTLTKQASEEIEMLKKKKKTVAKLMVGIGSQEIVM